MLDFVIKSVSHIIIDYISIRAQLQHYPLMILATTPCDIV